MRPTSSLELTDDYRYLLAAFVAADARFLVVGAHALSIHGALRATSISTSGSTQRRRMRIPFLGRDALIKNKRASGRMKDLGDIEALGEG
ncbi:MAG: hypothetical protein ABI442_13645 [Gemmatimonadaceae bacterium]